MKTFSRVAVISAALVSIAIGPGAAPAQPPLPRVYVYQYTYYAEPALQNVVGSATGYCQYGAEYLALNSGQFSAYESRVQFGWCDGDMIIYE